MCFRDLYHVQGVGGRDGPLRFRFPPNFHRVSSPRGQCLSRVDLQGSPLFAVSTGFVEPLPPKAFRFLQCAPVAHHPRLTAYSPCLALHVFAGASLGRGQVARARQAIVHGTQPPRAVLGVLLGWEHARQRRRGQQGGSSIRGFGLARGCAAAQSRVEPGDTVPGVNSPKSTACSTS